MTSVPGIDAVHARAPGKINVFLQVGALQDDGKSVRLWAQDHDGWLTMDATATLR